jgi:phosphate regulon transcriptional regulator PhoB
MKRILVVDDEPDINNLIVYNLKKEGFSVTAAFEGEEALDSLKSGTFDLIVLDLMLPGIQGVDLCSILRRDPRTAHIPIIMLTAKGELVDKVRGLESGADDYMTKPFSPKELIARIGAVLRRTGEKRTADKIISIGDMRIDRSRYSVSKGNKLLHLSATEFNLLLYLVERRGRIFSRDQLLDAVWENEAYVEPRTVDVHISRIRTQIEDDPSRPVYIKTKRGVGYYVE